MGREAWQATVHRVAKESDMTERLSMHTQEYRNSRIGGNKVSLRDVFYPQFTDEKTSGQMLDNSACVVPNP